MNAKKTDETPDKQGDVSDIPEGEVVDEDAEITTPAATHEDLVAAERVERASEDQEFLVQSRARDRDVTVHPPMPQTSSYVYLNADHRPKDRDDNDVHRGHAVQVVQTRGPWPEAPGQVVFRCDCGYEWTVTWDQDYADAISNLSEDDLKELREVPERFADRLDARHEHDVDRPHEVGPDAP